MTRKSRRQNNYWQNYCVLFIVYLLSACAKSPDEEILIQINDHTISAREFRNRLNFLPYPGQYSENERKENMIATLIAERVFALAAEKMHLDTLARFRRLYAQYAQEAMYEQWMRAEISSHVKIAENELGRAYHRFVERRIVDYWIFPDENSAQEAREQISSGMTPEPQPRNKTIEFAESWEPVEDAIYTLKPGEISQPQLAEGNYYLFKLKKVIPHAEYSKHNFDYWRRSIEKRVKARKEMALVDAKLNQLMKDLKFTIKSQALKFVLGQLTSILYPDDLDTSIMPELAQHELQERKVTPSEMANQPFLIFDDRRVWTIGEFWDRLSVCPYPLNYRNKEELKRGIPAIIRQLVLFDSIVNDARQKQYHQSDYVKQETAMWRDNLLAKAFVHQITDTMKTDGKDYLEKILAEKANNYSIEVNRSALNKIEVLDEGMAVRKTHFPLRNAVPGFQLFDHKAKWYREIVP